MTKKKVLIARAILFMWLLRALNYLGRGVSFCQGGAHVALASLNVSKIRKSLEKVCSSEYRTGAFEFPKRVSVRACLSVCVCVCASVHAYIRAHINHLHARCTLVTPDKAAWDLTPRADLMPFILHQFSYPGDIQRLLQPNHPMSTTSCAFRPYLPFSLSPPSYQ